MSTLVRDVPFEQELFDPLSHTEGNLPTSPTIASQVYSPFPTQTWKNGPLVA